MSKEKKSKTEVEKIAAELQKELTAHKQNEMHRYAVEAGYLTALADGTADAKERQALAESMQALSSGLVIEWEVDALIDDINERIGAEGHAARCEVVGTKLKELGQGEAGLLIGAYVALATAGIDKKEAEMLERIGKAAGIEKKQVGAIVKKARNSLA
jgi:tellurite resistance protein